MLCRALLTAIAFSYLICVLVLSGMQKEDLDMSLLTKLQRHNINADDMDNKKLHKECLTKRSLDNNNDAKERSERSFDLNTTTVKPTTTSISRKKQDLIQSLDGIDVETVVNYFKNTQDTRMDNLETIPRYTDTVVDVIPTHSTQGYTYNIMESSYTKEADKLTRKSIDTSELLTIEYNKGQPKLESVMKFWDIYMKRNKPNKTINLTTKLPSATNSIDVLDFNHAKQIRNHDATINKHTETKPTATNNDDNINSKEVERISKILATYVSRKHSKQTQSPTRRKRKEDLNTITQQIERLLAESLRSEQNNTFNIVVTNNGEEITFDSATDNINLANSPPKQSYYFNNNIQAKVDEIINRFSRPNSDYISNSDLNSNAPFKTQIQFENRQDLFKYTTMKYEQVKEPEKQMAILPEEHYLTPKSYNYNTPVTSTETNKKEMQLLSPEMIRQIAETVKEIVLKDLRKEITSTTTTQSTTVETTVTSTTVATTTTSQKVEQDKLQRATQAIENFIKLLEQFKAVKEKPTTVPPDTKYKSAEKADKVSPYNVPINLIYHPPLAPIISYGVGPQPVKAVSRIDPYLAPHPSVMAPQYFEPKKPKAINILAPIHRTPIVNIRVNQMRSAPIMIQTNSGEIPPLGIPISEPQLLNRNIVLSTQLPPNLNKGERDRWNYIIKYGRNPDTIAELKKRKLTLSGYSNVNSQNREQEYKKLFQLDSRSRDRQRDIFQINYDYNENNNREYVNRGINRDLNRDINRDLNRDINRDLNREISRDINSELRYRVQTDAPQKNVHNIRGFHERLEGIEEWPQESGYDKKFESSDYSKVKISQRQQRPLSGKKGSKYDDTHFKNFLKTQQKVNDMLERILATRTKANLARSVETT